MSGFDDLLNLDGPSENTATTNANNDPFDLFSSGPATNENTGNSGGNLLDFGMDAQASADNGSSGKVSFEANTNPLYEFTNTDNKMESDSSNLLFDLNSEPTQKEVKSEASNLLYDYMQNEGQSNGHAEDGLTNGAENGVDLLGGHDSGDLLGGGNNELLGGGDDLMGGSADGSGGGVDLLGDGDSQNLMDDKTDLLGDPAPVNDKTDLVGDQEPVDNKQDLLEDREPSVVEEPVVTEDREPSVVEEPVVTETPDIIEEPEIRETPDIIEEPEETVPNDQVKDIADNKLRETTQTRSRSSSEGSQPDQDEDKKGMVTKETEQVVETKSSTPDENALKVNGASEISENGISEEDAVRDPDVFRETPHEKDEIHFAEMNNVRQKFESGKTSSDEQTPKKVSVKDEYDQGGEFENEPVKNPDVVREADQPPEELPEVGMAKNLVSRFKSISEEKSKAVPKARAASPPRKADKVEYESQPTEHLPQHEAKVESGVFESEPKGHEDVVRSGDVTEDFKPEQGSAKNILNRFKEIETESSKVTQLSPKREMTPDRSGKVEYVSEPRGESIQYNEAKSETGVFENVPQSEEDVVRSGDKTDEVLPEAGAAKSVLSKFKQMESEVGNKPPPSPKREISHDKSAKVEYVTEPRGYLEKYEPQTESGEFESTPVIKGEVIRSGEATEEVLPEAGAAKKTMERFKEIQKQSSSPVSSSSRGRAITPPREVSPGRTVAGVVENNPEAREDVIRSGEAVQEPLPEQGSTKNILNKFKEIQTSGSQSSSPGRKPKEFTPPPDSGVYENTPSDHLVIETRQSESGVLENTPSKSVADVARERETTPETEMPEQGYAKNMVSKWKQLESSSGSAKSTSSTSPRFKQFTPPRDRGPLSPKSPIGVTNGVHPSELPGQYQPQESTVIVENNPEVKEGIYRESDTDWTAGMPQPNTTSSMLQKFKQIQSKAKEDETSQAPVTRKEKGMFKVVQTEKCAACQKTVYAMEKLEMNGHIYHKNCFKCSHCSARLTPKTFSMNEGVIYCVNHFKQLFARKGNYDEGFGRQQYKKKWGGDKKEGATA